MMKHLKTYKIFESRNDSKLISQLNFYGIINYTINEDGTVDVDGGVYIFNRGLSNIPFKFGKVTGDFDCSRNKLKTLEGCPKEVGRDFRCDINNLDDLIGGPEYVGRYYNCAYNRLETLEGCAGDIGGILNCMYNKLTSLDCSSVIEGNIYCSGNGFTEKPEFFGVCGGNIFI